MHYDPIRPLMNETSVTELSKDSPLRRLPAQLNLRQRLFLDGIRLSIEMVLVAYDRLWRLLSRLSELPSGTPSPDGAHAAAMLDAWSIIDGVHRLRYLLQQTPNLKKSAVTLQLFRRQSQGVEDLRHHVQHLDQEYAAAQNNDGPAWGQLAWIRPVHCGPPEAATTHAIVAGAIVEGTIRLVNPVGKTHHGLVDHIELAVSEKSINLSEMTRAIGPLVCHLEAFVSNLITAQRLAPGGSDMLLSVGPLKEGSDLGGGTGPLKSGDALDVAVRINRS